MCKGITNALKIPEMLTKQVYTELFFAEAAQRIQYPSIKGIATETMAYNKITDTKRAGYLILKNRVDLPTDWLKKGLREFGTKQNYQLSASGSDKNMKYFVSAIDCQIAEATVKLYNANLVLKAAINNITI